MKRAIISFLILLAATPIWLYFFPETREDEAQVKSVRSEARSWGEVPEDELQKRVEEYLDVDRLFPDPNDWRRQDPIFIAYEGTYFIFLKNWPQYDQRRNDVPIEICTFVWLPPATPDELKLDKEAMVVARSRRAIVLEMKDVIFAFNRNIGDFLTSNKRGGAKFEPSAFKTAQVNGEFVVRGGDETDEKNPNFSFRTRGVLLSPKQLRSNSKFTFQIGPHYGTGQGLSISFSVPIDLQDYVAKSQRREIEEAQTDEERETAFLNETFREGNLSSGVSIESVELSNIDLIHLFPRAFRFDIGGKRSLPNVDELEVGCQKGVNFERSALPGEWVIRFNGDVDAILKSNMERVCRLKGDSFQLYFQDHEMQKLAESSFSSVRNRTLRTKPSGKLARLQTTKLLAKGEDAPLTFVYVPTSTDPTKSRSVKVQAMRAYYNVEKREFKLLNTLDGPGAGGVSSANVDPQDGSAANIAPVIVTVTEETRGGPSYVSSLKSPMIVASFDENSELSSLNAVEEGSISTKLTSAKNETMNVVSSWEKGLLICPVKGDDGFSDGTYRMVTSGTTRCVAEGMGAFEAKEANFWFRLEETDGASSTVANLHGRGDSLSSRFSMTPICAIFSDSVTLETERGVMRVNDLARIRFSDQSGRQGNATLVASNSETPSMDGLAESFCVGADGSAPAGTFEVEGDHLDLDCELFFPASGRGKLRLIRSTLAGNVRFRGENADGEVVASFDSDCVTASNPLTPEMKFLVWSQSKNAVLNLNGMNLEGKKTYVDAARNMIQIYGPGKVALQPSTQKKKRGDSKSTALDMLGSDSFLVEWTGGVAFDGNYLRFLSNSTFEAEATTKEAAALAAAVEELVRGIDPIVAGEFAVTLSDTPSNDEDGVRLTMSDGYMVCDETRVTPKEHIDLLNFKTDGDSLPEIDSVECLSHSTERPVVMHYQTRSPEANAADTFNGYYNLQCSGIHVDWNNESFTVDRGGYLEATLLSSDGGVSSLDAGVVDKKFVAKEKSSTSEKNFQWVRISAEFGLATGLLKDNSVKVTEGVHALLCDVEGPNVRATLFDSTTWPSQAIVCNSSDATYRSVATNPEGKGHVEADARGNVTFRLGEYTGTCESLSYASTKKLLTLTGSGNAKARIVQQAYSGAPRTVLAEFMTGRIRLGADMKLEVEGGEIQLNKETIDGLKLK